MGSVDSMKKWKESYFSCVSARIAVLSFMDGLNCNYIPYASLLQIFKEQL